MISQKNLSPSRSSIYYGANDGTLRAVDTVTGRERWAFFGPEFFARTVPTATPTNVFARMRNGSPQISFLPLAPSEALQPKDYFLDGSPAPSRAPTTRSRGSTRRSAAAGG